MQRRNQDYSETYNNRVNASAAKSQECQFGMDCPYRNSTCRKIHLLAEEEESQSTIDSGRAKRLDGL
jgi:hypothetical protein